MSHKLRSAHPETFNELFKGIFDGHGSVPTKGLRATRRFALGALVVAQLTLLARSAAGLNLRIGLKALPQGCLTCMSRPQLIRGAANHRPDVSVHTALIRTLDACAAAGRYADRSYEYLDVLRRDVPINPAAVPVSSVRVPVVSSRADAGFPRLKARQS